MALVASRLGLLNIAAFYTANFYLSVSTAFSRAAGMLVRLAAPEHVAANAYWQNVKPILDWQFMFMLGIPIGAYLAARLNRRYPLIQDNLLNLGDYGKLTTPTLLGVDPLLVIVPFAIVVSGILLWMDRIDSERIKQ
jgi:Sulphur transport